jgi:hypothetical protein
VTDSDDQARVPARLFPNKALVMLCRLNLVAVQQVAHSVLNIYFTQCL